ncbi:hypothetical protein BV25DRAFT_1989350 [Artomyces pyxidatus]|uniref:Uncharacterized protein n=1 Tax=Artomyces pyxidatus TaxID=48021 RepID=A0ACB8T881_9AGAM|nr:hypothetical protein BV25DRAFT_1989350 [Artomyces pyxidatus]
MPSYTSYQSPLAGAPRPPLPLEHVNPHIKKLDATNLPAVKFQEIIREGQSTIVARMKVPTPSGHAFILRRLDTGAISLTTMFRAAFPTASEEQEKEESAWIKANHDLSSSNRAGKARFAGTWVSAEVAQELAGDYSLEAILSPLTDATPDPNTEYRKSSRAQQQSPGNPSPTAKQQLPTPSPSMSLPVPNPPKRSRREASPALTAAVPIASTSPKKAAPSSTLSVVSPRRSTRTASPAPAPVPQLVTTSKKSVTSPKTPRSPLKSRRVVDVTTPAGSDETAVEDDVAEVAGPDMNQDIAEQKELIAYFKKQREASRQGLQGEDAEMLTDEDADKKREREEEDVRFDFKEPVTENQERQIATNRRVRLWEMTSQRRSFAWGVAAFAAAFGAVTLIPNPWF